MAMEIGVLMVSGPGRAVQAAQMVEQLGFDHVRFPERERYDMREHTRAGAAHAAGLPDEFVDWFGIAGPVDRALPRFRQLAALGLDFITVIPGSTGMPREIAAASLLSLAQQIAPALRASA